jgi:hypothetical protein
MQLHVGERVYWGAPEVIYLEGKIVSLRQETAIVHVERATSHSAHLIGSNVPFAANGLKQITGDSPPGTTDQRQEKPTTPRQMSDEEKLRSAAAVAVHDQHGYTLPAEKEQELIDQIAEVLQKDPVLRARIITSMDELLKHEI